jgi:hypothetical protein
MAPSGHSQDYLRVLTSCHRALGCFVPSVLHFDAKNNVLRHTFHGRLTDTVLVEGYYKAGKYVARHPPSRIISDFSDVTSIEVSSQTVRTLAATPPKLPVGCTRVFVTPQHSLYGVARMFQILAEKSRPDLRIVRTLDEAYRLLGITSADFIRIDPEDFVEDQSA